MARLYNKKNKQQLKEQLLRQTDERTTLSFYRYHRIADVQTFRDELYVLFSKLSVFGRVYVASEGINAQISVPSASFSKFKDSLYNIPFLNGVRLNVAIDDDGKSFYVLKIKVRDKILADGLADDEIDLSDGGQHIDAVKFNTLTDSDQTVVVDMRNHYESEVGHFEKAICPDVETFRSSLEVVEQMIEPHRDKDIIMYCTGGIRCEKATAYFKKKGFEKLYQLDGGIIEYARQVEEKGLENRFKGKNFVFDERLGERITSEVIAQCHQCGKACDTHVNCANDACHLLFIQCSDCAVKFHSCCSKKCSDFIKLPAEEQALQKSTMTFNGSKFGKGRYKANRAGVDLL